MQTKHGLTTLSIMHQGWDTRVLSQASASAAQQRHHGGCDMTPRQLHIRAYTEWQRSPDIKREYHTFEYYWWEKYARVYGLSARADSVATTVH